MSHASSICTSHKFVAMRTKRLSFKFLHANLGKLAGRDRVVVSGTEVERIQGSCITLLIFAVRSQAIACTFCITVPLACLTTADCSMYRYQSTYIIPHISPYPLFGREIKRGASTSRVKLSLLIFSVRCDFRVAASDMLLLLIVSLPGAALPQYSAKFWDFRAENSLVKVWVLFVVPNCSCTGQYKPHHCMQLRDSTYRPACKH